MDYIAENKIPLEVCPISNVRTRAVKSIMEHPIRKYYEHGLIISVHTDDTKMFNTSLADEYRLLVQNCGFSEQEICKIILLGIESSWLLEEKKNSLVQKFETVSLFRTVELGC